MRILHTSDWHLGRMLENISRIDEQSEFIDWLVDCCNENSIDLVLVAGDVYDTYNPSAKAEELFYSAMDRLGEGGKRSIVVIAGNHDSPERLEAARSLAYRNNVFILGFPGSCMECSTRTQNHLVASGPGWLELSPGSGKENVVLLIMPYPSESRLEELLSEESDEVLLNKAYSERISSILNSLANKYFRKDTVNIATGHFFALGGKVSDSERTLQIGGAMAVDPASLPDSAHYIALGHLHHPQKIKSECGAVYYSGSPLAYSFSESDVSKLVYIVEAVPGCSEIKIEKEFIPCGKPLKKWIAENGIEQALEWCAQGRDKNAWIDLEIYTERVLDLTEQKRLRELNPGIINIRPVFKSAESKEKISISREGRKIEELFREFHLIKTGCEPPEELMQAFIEIVNDEDDETVCEYHEVDEKGASMNETHSA